MPLFKGVIHQWQYVIIYYLRNSLPHYITYFFCKLPLKSMHKCHPWSWHDYAAVFNYVLFHWLTIHFFFLCVNLHVWIGHTYCLIVSYPILLKSDHGSACYIHKDLSYPNGSHISATLIKTKCLIFSLKESKNKFWWFFTLRIKNIVFTERFFFKEVFGSHFGFS